MEDLDLILKEAEKELDVFSQQAQKVTDSITKVEKLLRDKKIGFELDVRVHEEENEDGSKIYYHFLWNKIKESRRIVVRIYHDKQLLKQDHLGQLSLSLRKKLVAYLPVFIDEIVFEAQERFKKDLQ